MALETSTDVEQLKGVDNGNDETVPAASDDYDAPQQAGLTVDANTTETISVDPPNRADVIRIHVEPGAALDVEVRFLDTDGNTVTRRGPSDNSDYSTDGTTDVFTETAVMSPWVEVAITDTSGGQQSVNYTVMAK